MKFGDLYKNLHLLKKIIQTCSFVKKHKMALTKNNSFNVSYTQSNFEGVLGIRFVVLEDF